MRDSLHLNEGIPRDMAMQLTNLIETNEPIIFYLSILMLKS